MHASLFELRETPVPALSDGQVLAQVIESKHPKFKPGDIINYLCGWQEYFIFEPDGDNLVPPTKLPGHLDPALLLALSLTGLTAYFGLLEVG